MLAPKQNGFRAMVELLLFIDFILAAYMYILLAAAILSWLVVFNVVNTRNHAIAVIGDFLYRITEPLLQPIRRRVPNVSGIDLSFLVLVLVILFIRMVIIPILIRAVA
jgi:YggT family protein